MKKHNFSKLLTFLMLFSFAVLGILTLTGMVSIETVYQGLLGTGSIGTAMAAGATESIEGSPTDTDSVSTASSNLLADEISKKIVKIKPAATPLDTILRSAKKPVRATAWKYRWYSVDMRGVQDTIATTFDTSASGTFNSTTSVHTITVTNIHIWSEDDNILVNGINGGDDDELVLHVVAKNSSTSTLSVIAVNGLGEDEVEIPDLPQGTVLTRIGNSKSELDAQTDPYAVIPTDSWNYAQIHMAQVEEGVYESMHNKEVTWGIDDYKLQAIYDMKRSAELTTLFGARNKLTDPIDNNSKYFSGGITRYITKSIDYTLNAITQSDFVDWTKSVFEGNAGSDTRYLFAGPGLISQIGKISTVQKQIDAKSTEVKWGIRFYKIETNFGTLMIKMHNLLAYAGWTNKGIVLDMNNIDKHVFQPMYTTKLNLKETGQRNTMAYKLEEAFGVALKYPDTHAIIQPESSSS